MKQFITALIVIIFALVSFAENNHCIAESFKKAPVIDGKADDECWKTVKPVCTSFLSIEQAGEKMSTEVKLGWTKDHLYLLISCDKDEKTLVPKRQRHDNIAVSYHDSIQLFFGPDIQPVRMQSQRKSVRYGQFIFNINGDTYDRIGTDDPQKWNPKWKVKTSVKKNKWIAEVEIPFIFIPSYEWIKYNPLNRIWNFQIVRKTRIEGYPAHSSLFKIGGMYDVFESKSKMFFTNKTKAEAEKIYLAICREEKDKELKRRKKDIAKYKSNIRILKLKRIAFGAVPHSTMINSDRVYPNTIPDMKKSGSTVTVTLCPGEFEPASIAIWSPRKLKNVRVKARRLKNWIDIRWVKCWYQGGQRNPLHNGKRYLRPELLLKNPQLVAVDHTTQSNIYPHKTHESDIVIAPRSTCYYKPDAKKLQALDELQPGKSQQVWLTVKAPKNCKPGTYKTIIEFCADGVKTVKVPIKIKVLDFKLQPSKLIHGVYATIWSNPVLKDVIMSRLKNLYDHGVNYPTVRCETPMNNDLHTILSRMKSVGFPQDKVFIHTDYQFSYKRNGKLPTTEQVKERARAYLKTTKQFGIKDVYLYLSDEAKKAKLRAEKRVVDAMHEVGAKSFVAVMRNFYKDGSFIDAPVVEGCPVGQDLVDKIHTNGGLILSYNNPQCGAEVPETYRRNYGLLLWSCNFDGSMDYAYWSQFKDVWDDFDTPIFRDHNMIYPTANGGIDTIQWEGWREGVDDCRYLATLQYWIEKCQGKGKTYVANDALKWLAEIKKGRGKNLKDLNAIRKKMISYIIKCKKSM